MFKKMNLFSLGVCSLLRIRIKLKVRKPLVLSLEEVTGVKPMM